MKILLLTTIVFLLACSDQSQQYPVPMDSIETKKLLYLDSVHNFNLFAHDTLEYDHIICVPHPPGTRVHTYFIEFCKAYYVQSKKIWLGPCKKPLNRRFNGAYWYILNY